MMFILFNKSASTRIYLICNKRSWLLKSDFTPVRGDGYKPNLEV
jgi:hypothetical protein